MTAAPLADAEARRRVRDDLASTLVVEAAAGTGKTTALVGRIVALLTSGTTTLDRIVAVTFTEKAAGEMKLRLREAIERARRDATADVHARLDGALAGLEMARITTIHAFAADLLRSWPLEAAIDPEFEMAGDEAERRLFAEAFDDWFARVLEAPPEGVRRVLRRRGRRDADAPRESLRLWREDRASEYPNGLIEIINQHDAVWLIHWSPDASAFQFLAQTGHVETAKMTVNHVGNALDLYRFDRMPETPCGASQLGLYLTDQRGNNCRAVVQAKVSLANMHA